MNKFISGAVAALLVAGGIALAAPASATPNHEGVCSDLSTGHIPGAGPSMDISAPEGKLIAEVCVKAGSVNQGNGPEYTPVDPALAEVTITHSSGKDISHYSVRYVDVPVEEEPDPEAVPTQPTAQAGIETCVEGQSVDANGTITLPAFEGGHWAEGEGTLTNVPPGEYGFTPVIHEGYTYDGPEMLFVTVPASVDVQCDTPEPVLNSCEVGVSTHSTNLANLWGNVDTRSAGHYEYVEGGLRAWTDDASSNAKVSLGQAIAFPLHDTGVIALDWTGTTPPPGVNLFVNFGADGMGTLVYESVYGQDLWLTNGSSAAVKANAPVNGGGNGSQWHGTIDQWLSVYPEAQVVGIAFSLGSGVHGDGVIHSITVGCGTHTFDYEAPVVIPEEPEPVVTVETEEVVDCESGTVTTTTTTTTVGWVYDEETNTWLEAEPVVEVVTDDREATEEECPVVTPTPTPTPTETPAAPAPPAPAKAAASDALAVTGADSLATLGWLTGGALAVAFGGLLTVLGLRRRQVRSE